jgi:hypothetical protein
MPKNFKKGFNRDYRVKLTPDRLRTFCKIDWPAFGIGWPLDESSDKIIANRDFLSGCRGAWTPRWFLILTAGRMQSSVGQYGKSPT